MTYYPKKASSNWTEKHTNFSIKHSLGTVGGNLWKYLLSLGKEGTKIDYILNHFQEYIKRRRGKPHDFGYVKKKFNQLISLGIISIVKKFENNCYSLIVHHPSSLALENKVQKNSQNSGEILKTEASKDYNCEALSNSSSKNELANNDAVATDTQLRDEIGKVVEQEKPVDLRERFRQLQIIRLCAKYGILFNPKKQTTKQLYKYPIEEIEESLELYKRKRKTRYIENPQGWLIGCLQDRYYDDYNYSSDSFVADMMEIYNSVYQTGRVR